MGNLHLAPIHPIFLAPLPLTQLLTCIKAWISVYTYGPTGPAFLHCNTDLGMEYPSCPVASLRIDINFLASGNPIDNHSLTGSYA